MVQRRTRRPELEHQLIRIAPEPILARFIRADDRVLGGAEMFGCVLSWRVVAAADVPAAGAHAQMDPPAARLEALHAAIAAGRHVTDLVEVHALSHGSIHYPTAPDSSDSARVAITASSSACRARRTSLWGMASDPSRRTRITSQARFVRRCCAVPDIVSESCCARPSLGWRARRRWPRASMVRR